MVNDIKIFKQTILPSPSSTEGGGSRWHYEVNKGADSQVVQVSHPRDQFRGSGISLAAPAPNNRSVDFDMNGVPEAIEDLNAEEMMKKLGECTEINGDITGYDFNDDGDLVRTKISLNEMDSEHLADSIERMLGLKSGTIDQSELKRMTSVEDIAKLALRIQGQATSEMNLDVFS